MDSTVEIVHQCASHTNFIARAFCEGGVAMYFIGLIGALVIALILERVFSLQKLTINKSAVSENIFGMILQGQVQQAISFCDASPSFNQYNESRFGAGDEQKAG